MATHAAASGAPASSTTKPSMRHRPGSTDGVALAFGTGEGVLISADSPVADVGAGAAVPGGVVRGVGIAVATNTVSVGDAVVPFVATGLSAAPHESARPKATTMSAGQRTTTQPSMS